MPMLLSEIANTSNRVAQTRSRLKKIEFLAECLKRLGPAELEIGVAYLMGDLRQGRTGIGPAMVRSLSQTQDRNIWRRDEATH